MCQLFSMDEGTSHMNAGVPQAWSALLTREQLCAYLALSPAVLMRICPVPALALGVRALRWRRADIDAWVANLPVRSPKNPHPEVISLPAPYELAGETRRSDAVARARLRVDRNEKQSWKKKKGASHTYNASQPSAA